MRPALRRGDLSVALGSRRGNLGSASGGAVGNSAARQAAWPGNSALRPAARRGNLSTAPGSVARTAQSARREQPSWLGATAELGAAQTAHVGAAQTIQPGAAPDAELGTRREQASRTRRAQHSQARPEQPTRARHDMQSWLGPNSPLGPSTDNPVRHGTTYGVDPAAQTTDLNVTRTPQPDPLRQTPHPLSPPHHQPHSNALHRQSAPAQQARRPPKRRPTAPHPARPRVAHGGCAAQRPGARPGPRAGDSLRASSALTAAFRATLEHAPRPVSHAPAGLRPAGMPRPRSAFRGGALSPVGGMR